MRRSWNLTLLVVTVAAVTACERPERFDGLVVLTEGSVAGPIRLLLRTGPDPFNGPKAVGFSLLLENRTGRVLHDCHLVINNAYTAGLGVLEVYRVGVGNRTRNDSKLEAELTLEFHHDNNNHLILRSAAGESMPSTTEVETVILRCNEGRAVWLIGNGT